MGYLEKLSLAMIILGGSYIGAHVTQTLGNDILSVVAVTMALILFIFIKNKL